NIDNSIFPATLLDAPKVANYSAIYRAPLTAPEKVEDEIQASAGTYGYNEASRRFELPPPSGRAESSFYASPATTDLVKEGPIKNEASGALQRIDSQITSESQTRDHSTGMRLSIPQASAGPIRSIWSVGVDFKDHIAGTFPTNNFITTTLITNNNGVITARR